MTDRPWKPSQILVDADDDSSPTPADVKQRAIPALTAQDYSDLVAFRSPSQPKKRLFLLAFAECGTILHAAIAAGISRRQVEHWRDATSEFYDAEFTDAFEHEAKELFADSLEHILFTRAKRETVPLIVALKGARPEKYKDNAQVNIDQSQHLTINGDAVLAAILEAKKQL